MTARPVTLADSVDEHVTAPEVVDEDGRPLPVPVPGPGALEQPPGNVLAAPVAAATGGLVAGVMTILFVRGMRNRPRTVRAGGRRRGTGLEVTRTRSFVPDVYLVKR